MIIENLTNVGNDPVDGDTIKITHASGAIEIRQYWTPVIEEEQPVEHWKLTHLAFKNRFPRDKWKAAKVAAKTNIDFEDFFESFDLATYIDIQRQDTIDDVNNFLNPALPESIRLTQAEVDAVLLVPASEDERYKGP